MEKDVKALDVVQLEDYQLVGRSSGDAPLRFEGKITRIKYFDPGQSRSSLEIFRNYDLALRGAGAAYLNGNARFTSGGVRMAHHIYRLPSPVDAATPTYVLLFINSPQWYALTIVEPHTLRQEVNVSLATGLDKRPGSERGAQAPVGPIATP